MFYSFKVLFHPNYYTYFLSFSCEGVPYPYGKDVFVVLIVKPYKAILILGYRNEIEST